MLFTTPTRLWYDPDPTPWVRAARLALSPLSAAWWLGRGVHRGLYASGVLAPARLGARVVGVGNVVTGGAGKTPVVGCLARLAAGAGWRVAVVGRGHGVSLPPDGVRVSDGSQVLVDAAAAGDEPVMLARDLVDAGVAVWAGPDRARVGRRAIEEGGATLVLLDDALQHHRVAQDVRIAVLRCPAPLGNARLLPAGPLRDRPHVLCGVDAVVLLGSDPAGAIRADLVRRGVRADRVVGAVLEPCALVDVVDATHTMDPGNLHGQRVVVAAAVARPDAVADTVRALGAVVVSVWARPDHARWAAVDVAALGHRARRAGADAVVVTDKDRAGWPASVVAGVPIWCLRVGVAWTDPAAAGQLRRLLGDPPPGG